MRISAICCKLLPSFPSPISHLSNPHLLQPNSPPAHLTRLVMMEAPPELLSWLHSTQLFPSLLSSSPALPQPLWDQLASAVAFDLILRRVYVLKVTAKQGAEPTAGSLTETAHSAEERAGNWELVKQLAEPLGLALDEETVAEAAAGSRPALVRLLAQCRDLEPGEKPETGDKKSPGVFLDSMETDKALFQADSCIEFFILSFCANFSIKPKQGAGLLTKNNEILARVIAKGLKGDFDPIIAWLQSIYQNTERLSDLILHETDKNSLIFVLPILKPGLLSKNLEVVQWTCKVFSRLAMDLEERGLLQYVWTWFVGDKGCLELIVTLCGKYKDDLVSVAVEMMLHIGQFNLIQLFSYHLKNLLQTPAAYFAFIHDLLPSLKETEWIRDEVLSSRILNYWLESALREADAYTSQARSTVMLFLASLWAEFFCTLEESDTVLLLIAGSLKNCFRDRQTMVRASAVAVTMEMLAHLIQEKHAKAMVLYQTLVVMVIEMDASEPGREVVICNMTQLVASVPTLPVTLLVEPLVKRIHTSDPPYSLDIFDFSLFAAIAEHPRLLLQDAIQLADLIGKVYMNDQVASRAALPAFCMLIARFVEMPAMQDYLTLYCRYCLSEALAANAEIQQAKRKKSKGVVEETEQLELLTYRRVRDLALEIIAWLLQLQSEPLNTTLKQVLVAYELSYEEAQNQQCKGLLVLLTEFGDPQLLLQTAIPEAEESPDLQAAPVQTWEEEKPVSAAESISTVGMEIVPASDAIQEVPKKLPFPWKRAFHDLREAKEKAKRRLQRLEESSSQLNSKSQSHKSAQASLPSAATTSRPIDPLLAARFIPKGEEYSFVDISGEEQRLLDGLLRRFGRALKMLFRNYAALGHARKKEVGSEFDWLAQRKSLLPESGFIKLFADYSLAPKLISKEEVRAGIKLYCSQVLHQPETKELDYTGFLYCFCQFACCIFSKDPYDYSYLHPFVSVRSLIDSLRVQAKSLGQSTELYDDPDPGAGDKDVVKQLSEQIGKHPGMRLPAGYVKVQDTDCRLVYCVSGTAGIPLARAAALEVLDLVLFRTFEVRLLEANVEFYTVNRVTGVGQKKEHVVLPPIYERRQSELKQKIKLHVEDPASQDKPKAVNSLTAVLKLEVAKSPAEDKEVYLQCALLLTDLLHSVGLNSSKVIQREEGKVKKAASLQPLDMLFDVRQYGGKRKEKWRERKVELDQKMQEIMVLKEIQKTEEAEKLRKEKEAGERRAKLMSEKLRKEKEERDRLFKDWSDQKEAKDKLQRQEEHKVKTESEGKTRKLREELKRKMNEKLKEAIAKRHQQWKQRAEVTASPTLLEELERNKKQFARIIQEDKKRLAEKDKHLAEFREFANSPEVASLQAKYRKHLELLFSLYSKQSLAKVEYDPTTFFNQMTLIEFSKFATQFGITPVLISADVLLSTFNALTKMKLRAAGVPATITYDEFLSALLRITDQASAQLRKLASGEQTQSLSAATFEAFCTWLGLEMPIKDFHEKVKKLQAERKHHRRLRSSGLELVQND